jgi:hypothetical protein
MTLDATPPNHYHQNSPVGHLLPLPLDRPFQCRKSCNCEFYDLYGPKFLQSLRDRGCGSATRHAHPRGEQSDGDD